MKKTYAIIFAAILLVSAGICANAESIATLHLEHTTFSSDGIHENALYRVFYLSDNEIWFNFLTDQGNGKLACFDKNGQLLNALSIPLEGNDPSILCFNHIGGRMIIGYKDDSTNRAEVVVVDSQGNEITRKTFSPEIYAIQMVPSDKGILYAGGIDTQDGMSVLYLAEIDINGDVIFEHSEAVATLEEDHGYVSSTLIYSDGGKHYAMIKNGIKDSLMQEERLVCFGENGQKVWETHMDETFNSNDIAVRDGHLVVVGSVGSRDEYGCLINQKGVVLYYDQDGTMLWNQVCNDVDSFYIALAAQNSCYALTGIKEGYVYGACIDVSGTEYGTSWLQLPETVLYARFVLTDEERLAAIGKTADSLYISTLK